MNITDISTHIQKDIGLNQPVPAKTQPKVHAHSDNPLNKAAKVANRFIQAVQQAFSPMIAA